MMGIHTIIQRRVYLCENFNQKGLQQGIYAFLRNKDCYLNVYLSLKYELLIFQSMTEFVNAERISVISLKSKKH